MMADRGYRTYDARAVRHGGRPPISVEVGAVPTGFAGRAPDARPERPVEMRQVRECNRLLLIILLSDD
jgi:hypothetical protein